MATFVIPIDSDIVYIDPRLFDDVIQSVIEIVVEIIEFKIEVISGGVE